MLSWSSGSKETEFVLAFSCAQANIKGNMSKTVKVEKSNPPITALPKGET